jgi:hypothetical protein
MKCRLGGIRNNKILPKRAEIHKAIIGVGDDCSAFVFNWLSGAHSGDISPKIGGVSGLQKMQSVANFAT